MATEKRFEKSDQLLEVLTRKLLLRFRDREIKNITFFGSYVHGTVHRDSDIDVFIDNRSAKLIKVEGSMWFYEKRLEIEDRVLGLDLGRKIDIHFSNDISVPTRSALLTPHLITYGSKRRWDNIKSDLLYEAIVKTELNPNVLDYLKSKILRRKMKTRAMAIEDVCLRIKEYILSKEGEAPSIFCSDNLDVKESLKAHVTEMMETLVSKKRCTKEGGLYVVTF